MPDSALDQAIAAVGQNEGVPGRMTPSEMIALETGSRTPQATQETPAQQAPAPSSPEKQSPQQDVELDDLLQKVEKGEQLTEEEQATLLIHEKKLEADAAALPVKEEKTYNIGGKLFTESEVELEARKAFGIGDLKVNEQARALMIETWYKAQNKTEFSRSVSQKSQEVAAREKVAIAREQEAIAKRMQAETALQATKKERARLAKERAILESQANDPVDESNLIDPNTGQPDPEKQYQFFRKRAAVEQLKRLQEQDTEAQQAELMAQNAALAAEIEVFISEHPEYQTKTGTWSQLWGQLGSPNVDRDDKRRLIELDEIFTFAASKGISASDAYDYLSQKDRLIVKQVAQSPTANGGNPTLPIIREPKSIAEMIRRHKERLKTGSTPMESGGSRTESNPQERPAQRIIRESKAILGQADRDDFLHNELKY